MKVSAKVPTRIILFAAAVIVGFSLHARADDAAGQQPAPITEFSRAEIGENVPGGDATSRVSAIGRTSFGNPSGNLGADQRAKFNRGNTIFRTIWVPAGAPRGDLKGLGPLFNARSCERCHIRDGRGHPPAAGFDDEAVSALVLLSIPPETDDDIAALADHMTNTIADPVYGHQLQEFAVPGLQPEGRIRFDYEEIPVVLSDGEVVNLRRPSVRITDLAHGPLHADAVTSVRVASPMIGLGLLETVPEGAIMALADPDDENGDGISGRANRVWDEARQDVVLGRFGWKAGQPTVRQQNAVALSRDMGVSTNMFPNAAGDCTDHQAGCRAAAQTPDANTPGVEASDEVLDLVTFYARNLAVPQRRNADAPDVLAGKALFYRAGCIACHNPKFVTGTDGVEPELAGQLIWPYTDLLLHDMGEGLADNRPEGVASGREWRTPPLWGIGLTLPVSAHTQFLHDGRARSLLEAILWHGGEAEDARDKVVAMNKQERDQLLAFLNSL